MMPMYMSSSQPGQVRPQGCYPHHVTMDASSSPASCNHWATPSPCYGSCFHGNFPPYSPYWAPCYPPQVPYHTCWMNHPHAPPCYIQQPFHVGYQHGFDSEKDVTGKNRCSNCSPQTCSPKDGSGVVIEEHEPEIEKGDHGEAVNRVRLTCPYPIVWMPHENARSQQHEQRPAQIKAPENTKMQKGDPKSFPFDENTIRSLMQNQDRNKMQNGKTMELPFDISKLKSLLHGQEGQIQKSREPRQLQYPVFWIPSQGKQEDAEASEKKERGNEGSDLKSVSSDHLNNDQIAQCDKGNYEGNAVSDAEEKTLVRDIPVESYKEPRNIPVKLLENHLPEPTEKIVKTEPVEETRKEQRRSSPPKASRLPPVCLRVDPLPKRRSGGSKSLSPPRRKEQTLRSEETKVASPLSSKMVETRTIPESCNVKCEKANKEKNTSEGCPKPSGTEKESVETKSDLQGVKHEIHKPCEAKENEEKAAKKTFIEEEAARIIQSRYRGYDVRRWEPIKKLKEIAAVREQMGDVKKRIEALDLSAEQHTEGKEIVVLGEMVMSLLLKLDFVQGLHPSIRDFRKSLARELSDMQENIDSLKKSSVEKEAVEEQVDTSSQTSDCPVSLEHSKLGEHNKMAFDSNMEKVCLPSPEKHLTSPENTADEQLVAEAEEVTGLSETLATDPEPTAQTCICEAVPEKIEVVLQTDPSSADGNEITVTNEEGKAMVKKLEDPLSELPQVVETTHGSENGTEVSEAVASVSENEERKEDSDYVMPSEKAVETVLPITQLSADGNEMRMTNNDDDKVMVEKQEEPLHELPEVVETTRGQAFEGLENATEVSETVANASESENRKGDDDSVLTLEKDVELSELPVGVVDDSMQLLSQDSSSSPGAEKTVVNPETASKEDANVDHSGGIDQETQVTEVGMSEETKQLREENQRFKETMETLVKAGREQLEVISKLTGRVKSLEKKLSQKKRTHIGRRKPNRGKQTTKSMSASHIDDVI